MTMLQKQRWNPFEELDSLFSFPRIEPATFSSAPIRNRTDLIEQNDKYIVKMEVPGVPEENLDVHINNGVLTVEGGYANEQHGEKDYKITEIYKGSFSRSFKLGSVDEESIQAWLENGILNIEIPKVDKNQTKRIPLKK